MHRFGPITALMALSLHVAGQEIRSRCEVWPAYIGSIRVSERSSIWQDYHYVPNSFAVARYGLSYTTARRQTQFTGGMAFVATSTAFTTDLVRNEFRPWAQVLGQRSLGPKLTALLRFRYDARFREVLLDELVTDEFLFYSRLRLMARIRYELKELHQGGKLHLIVMNELLYNTGGSIPSGMDQDRTFILLGISKGPVTLQAGPHLRVFPERAGVRNVYHGFTLWFIHTIDARRRAVRPEAEDPMPVGG